MTQTAIITDIDLPKVDVVPDVIPQNEYNPFPQNFSIGSQGNYTTKPSLSARKEVMDMQPIDNILLTLRFQMDFPPKK